jgi:hypothetical protein
MRLEGEVLFRMHPHSSIGISFVMLRVRVGDVVHSSDADAPTGNNHVGVVVGGGCRVSCHHEPRGKGNFYYVMILLFLITYLQFNY